MTKSYEHQNESKHSHSADNYEKQMNIRNELKAALPEIGWEHQDKYSDEREPTPLIENYEKMNFAKESLKEILPTLGWSKEQESPEKPPTPIVENFVKTEEIRKSLKETQPQVVSSKESEPIHVPKAETPSEERRKLVELVEYNENVVLDEGDYKKTPSQRSEPTPLTPLTELKSVMLNGGLSEEGIQFIQKIAKDPKHRHYQLLGDARKMFELTHDAIDFCDSLIHFFKIEKISNHQQQIQESHVVPIETIEKNIESKSPITPVSQLKQVCLRGGIDEEQANKIVKIAKDTKNRHYQLLKDAREMLAVTEDEEDFCNTIKAFFK